MSKPIAIITGASGGMGQACADRFARRYDLVIADINEQKLQALASYLRQKNTKVLAVGGDITDPEHIERLVDAALSQGQLAAVIHCAGVSPHMADPENILRINLLATALLLEKLSPHMHNGATTVCIASQAGTFAALGASAEIKGLLSEPLQADFFNLLCQRLPAPITPGEAYGLSKLGVQLLVQGYAFDWGRNDARIVSISPGMIDTPMMALELRKTPGTQSLLQETPLQRLGKPEEIAQTAWFLCSPEASFITGVDLLVDGGATNRVVAKLQRGEFILQEN